ncbi:hypothetical protein AB0J72_50925 [Dactylosporangium sp. NPDC049742]|uniref:hypothetical protein n=1 Tax=Dactylosporangium sp. NPDC049742 TaxID=3154737 RepID=UPI003440BC56
MGFWSTVRTTVRRPAEQLVFAALPAEGATPLVPRQGYVRVWLSQMFLQHRSTLLADWVPAAHTRVGITAGGRTTHDYGRVLRPEPGQLTDGVRLNFALTDLVPYEGGEIEVTAVLFGLQSGNHLDVAVDVLSLVSLLPVPALPVAAKVSESARDLVVRSDGRVHLDLHQTFSADGGGGAVVSPGHLAVVLAAQRDLADADLRVVGDRLHVVRDGAVVPLAGHDFMLLRLECRTERPDLSIPDADRAWAAAVHAWSEGDDTAADGYQRAARAAVLQSPLLCDGDRRRAVTAIAAQWQQLRDQAQGLTADAVPEDLDALVRRWSPAATSDPITPAEAFAM